MRVCACRHVTHLGEVTRGVVAHEHARARRQARAHRAHGPRHALGGQRAEHEDERGGVARAHAHAPREHFADVTRGEIAHEGVDGAVGVRRRLGAHERNSPRREVEG